MLVMLKIKQLMMLVVWVACFINVVHPMQAPLNTVLYIALAVIIVMHSILVLLIGKAIKLTGKEKLSFFVFGSIAVNQKRQSLFPKK
ncbi:DUF1145 domain-containing protein [Gallaecimonas mangrovi]|uniref:DUF1145 domain-containing protein n=1 Tax=Gallaecimonas mangrovi TaxID=2291597 RepID=UPI000E1FE06B|nr:DUF1145 domain-containing protein [Gallaecimonas mangrovi]